MPIDYDALIAPFRTAYFLQRHSISESLRKIAVWLTKRLRETEERERATRAYPIFGFDGDAVSAWIDASQHGALGAEGEPPPDGFWASAAAPFAAFWNGLLVAPQMIQAEGLLPNLMATLARTVKLILESLDRFATPDKSLFDVTTKKRWDDLFGEIGLFLRVVNDPNTLEQVKAFSDGGIAVFDVLREQFPSEPGEKDKSGMAGMVAPTLGVALAIPLAWQLGAQMAERAGFFIRMKLLEWAERIYGQALGIRGKAIDLLFVTLFAIGRQAVEWLVLTRAVVVGTLDLYSRFISQYLYEMEAWINDTSASLRIFGDDLVEFIRGLGRYLDSFLDIDLAGVAGVGLGITLRDILGSATPKGTPPEAPPIDINDIKLPNIATRFLGVPERGTFETALTDAGPEFAKASNGLFDAGIKSLTDLSETMGRAGSDAATMGSAARYQQVSDSAAALAEKTFGTDAARAKQVARDPIATAFESWLAGSGFDLIGRALPAYVAGMIQFWKREKSRLARDTPTSPHIQARRARVGRVRVSRMVIRVNEERDLDKFLSIEIAGRTGIGVAQAYQLAIAQPASAG